MSRWIRMQTAIFECPIFDGQPFGRTSAFLWLSQVWDGSDIHLIAKKFSWPASRVWKFLRELIAHGLLDASEYREVELFYRKQSTRTAIPTRVKSTVLMRDGAQCRYCGSLVGPFHFDHVFPWSKGGEHKVSNLVIACQPCNLKKHDKTIKELGWEL